MFIQAPGLARADDPQPAPGTAGDARPGYVPPGYVPPGYVPPGYVPPGYVPPGYVPPGYVPPGYVPPGYVPPATGPAEITGFDEAGQVPYGYTKVSRPRKGLIIGGAVTLGVTYGVSMLVAAIGEDLRSNGESSTDVSALWIPVAGPFVQLARSESATGKLYLVHLGLAQAAGAIMLAYGITSPKTVLVRNDRLSITPMVGNGASGMMVGGRF